MKKHENVEDVVATTKSKYQRIKKGQIVRKSEKSRKKNKRKTLKVLESAKVLDTNNNENMPQF